MRIGEILRDTAGLSEQQIEAAAQTQASSGKRLGSVLIEMGLVDPDHVAAALGQQHHVPPVKRVHLERIDADTIKLFSAELAYKYGAIPLGVSTKFGKSLVVALRDPTDRDALDTLQFACGMDIRPSAVSAFFLEQCLGQYYPRPEEPRPEIALSTTAATLTPEVQIPSAASRMAGRESATAAAPVNTSTYGGSTEPLRPVARTWGGGRSILGVVFTLIGFAAASHMYKKGCKAKVKSVPITGVFTAKHVSVDVEFPDGWNYLPTKNESQMQRGMKVRMALFYRGGEPEKPHDAFMLGYLDTNGKLPALDEDQFLKMVKVSAAGMKTPGSSPYSMHVGNCKLSDLRSEMAGECAGTARYKGDVWNMMVVMWLGDTGRFYIAAPMARETLAEARSWMGPVITSVTPLDP